MEKLHCKTLKPNACTKKELKWFLSQDDTYVYDTILDRIQIVIDNAERTISEPDLELIRKVTMLPIPSINDVISDYSYSPLDSNVYMYIDDLIHSDDVDEDESKQIRLLQMFAHDCILAASNITANCFLYEGQLYTYKDYKPVKVIGQELTELGYYILKYVHACTKRDNNND